MSASDDEYKKAARTITLADRAFPNLDTDERLRKAAQATEPSTSTALVHVSQAAADTAALAAQVDFVDEEPDEVAPPVRTERPHATSLAMLDECDDTTAILEEIVRLGGQNEPLVGEIWPPPTAPQESLVAAAERMYLQSLDVDLDMARRAPLVGRSGAVLLAATAAAAVGAAIVGRQMAREQEDLAAAEQADHDAAEHEERMKTFQQHLAAIDKKSEKALDAAHRNTERIADGAIVAHRGDVALAEAATVDRQIAHDERVIDAENRMLDRVDRQVEVRRADRRLERSEDRVNAQLAERRQGALPAHSDAGDSPVALAIDKVLEADDD